MNKRPSFFHQAGVLISRYFHIFVNNRQNLIMMMAIPLLTILIVCYVACPDMYAVKADEDHKINDGYPVLNWETVVQEKKSEEDSDEMKRIEPEKPENDVWNGKTDVPVTATKVNDENYFLITNAEQLAFLSKAVSNSDYEDYLTYNYLLQTDIDLNGRQFTPIGTKEKPFTGTFDGNGHIIKNLKMDSSKDNVGLFGYVKSNEKAKSRVEISGSKMTFYHNGIVENLQVQDADIHTSGKNAGIIAACISGNARIKSVSAKGGTVSADAGNVGGILGAAKSSGAEIYVCYTKDITVESKSSNVGGLAGDLASARLSGAYTTATITFKGKDGKDEHYGAIVGNCDDYEEQLKSLYYDNEVQKEYAAVNDKDYKDYALGVETETLKGYTAFLIPFKGIETAYALENPDEDLEEKLDDEDYDAEEDEDINPVYGFKKDGQIAAFYGTQVGIFMLVIVAIFVGVCNSIGEICKERNILKREYMTNLRLDAYVVSKLVVQGVVCAVQMIIVLFVFFLFVHNKEIPDSGIIFGNVWIEYYITMFLLTFAADVMSLVISSFVKSASGANSLIPIVLIVQIVFCGVMFKLDGIMDLLSNVMISKWGIRALSATTRLNDAQEIFLIENPSTQISMGSDMSIISSIFNSTAAHLLAVWGVLVAFIAAFAIICRFALISVKNDKR